MAQADPAKAVKDCLATEWADSQPDWTATLEVADDYRPVSGHPALLVADDGGNPVVGGAWMVGKDLMRKTLRLTAFARGRTEALNVVNTAIDFVVANHPAGVTRIENVSGVLETRDRATGAYLASVTVPVTVRPL
jgi:hypothetical protein